MTKVSVTQDQSQKSSGHNKVVHAIAWITGLYIIIDSINIRLSLAVRVAYGLAILTILLIAFAGLMKRHPRSTTVPLTILSLWAAYMVLELCQLPLSSASLPDALTDFAVVLSPFVFYLAVRLHIRRRLDILAPYIILTYTAFVATVVGWIISGGQRFEAPQIVAITGAWIFALAPKTMLPKKSRTIRVTAWLMVLALVPAILAARSRTSLVVWVLAGLIAYFAPGLRRGSRVVPALLLAMLATATLMSFQAKLHSSSAVPRVLAQTRLNAISSGTADASTKTRILEAQDVKLTMQWQGSFLDQIVGLGHGASYIPHNSEVIHNINSQTGRVHNIHVTPFMVWFRYGYAGLALFAGILLTAIMFAVRDVTANRDPLSWLSLSAILMFLIDLMLRNSTADPSFSFVLAAIFAARTLPRGSR